MNNLLTKHESRYVKGVMRTTWTGQPVEDYIIEIDKIFFKIGN